MGRARLEVRGTTLLRFPAIITTMPLLQEEARRAQNTSRASSALPVPVMQVWALMVPQQLQAARQPQRAEPVRLPITLVSTRMAALADMDRMEGTMILTRLIARKVDTTLPARNSLILRMARIARDTWAMRNMPLLLEEHRGVQVVPRRQWEKACLSRITTAHQVPVPLGTACQDKISMRSSLRPVHSVMVPTTPVGVPVRSVREEYRVDSTRSRLRTRMLRRRIRLLG